MLERVWGVRYVGSRGIGKLESRWREIRSEVVCIMVGEVRLVRVWRACVTSGSCKSLKGVRARFREGGGGSVWGDGRRCRMSWETHCNAVLVVM